MWASRPHVSRWQRRAVCRDSGTARRAMRGAGLGTASPCTALPLLRWQGAIVPGPCFSVCCAGIRSHKPKARISSASRSFPWAKPALHLGAEESWPMAALYTASGVKNENASGKLTHSKFCFSATTFARQRRGWACLLVRGTARTCCSLLAQYRLTANEQLRLSV